MLATTSGETLNIISNIECEIEIEDFFKQLRNDISIFKNSPVIDEEKLVSKSISRSLFKYDNYSKNVSAIKDIIFRASIDCEKYVGGSSDTFLLILEKILSLHKGNRLKYIQDSLSNSMELIKYKKRLSQNDISKIIKNYQPESKKIINDFIKLLSPRTILSLEKSDFFEDRIIQKQNLHFDVTPIPGFCSGNWIKEEVSILMVDGIIEEVSQIHHFLTQAFDTKEPFLLISRAYKPEVLKTIAENNMRGNTDIMVMDLGSSMKNHHFLRDISRIFNLEYASPEFGDVISVFVRRGLSKLKKVAVNNAGIDFYVENEENLDIVRSEVLDMAYKNLGSEANDLIQQRLKSLSSDQVIVSIGKDSLAKNPIIIEELDLFIRRIKSLMRDSIVFTKIKDIDKINKIYSSIEIPFIYNKMLSVLNSIENINCMIIRR